MQRKKFVWDVVLQDEQGNVHRSEAATYWSPEKVTEMEVAVAHAAEVSVHGGAGRMVPISAQVRQ